MKDMFFKYASDYVAGNPDIKFFKATDETYADFNNFLNARNFDFKSSPEKKLDELKKLLADKNLDGTLSDYIKAIEQTINSEESAEMQKAKEEIKQSIEEEINKMIVEEKEQIEATFSSDKILQEAISIILDSQRYNSILGIN